MVRLKKNIIEKRQYKRQDYYCLLKYRGMNKHGTYAQSITSLRNISGGGVLFKSKEYLPMDSELEMEISIPPLEWVANVSAKVVRFEENKARKTYKIGAMFINIKEEDRKKIVSFVNLGKKNE